MDTVFIGRTEVKSLIGLILAACCSPAFAGGLSVTHAWAAATAPGQEVGGAYMDISSDMDAKLVRAESPAAKKVMIHNMMMKNGVMEMRAMKSLAIPAGKTVRLSPDGMHLMLMDIRKPLLQGEHVPIKLTFVHGGKEIGVDVDAEVMSMESHMDMH